MRVDEAERRRLAGQVGEDPRQGRMFENIGEIAGVEGMPVVHRRARRTGRLSAAPAR